MTGTGPVLEVRDLSVEFETPAGAVRALRGVTLAIEPGETFGVAGESGSGKSTLAYAILRYLAPNGRLTAGTIRFQGEDLLAQPPAALQRIRGRRIAMVYQDPAGALNPSLRVGDQVAEVLRIHERADAGAAWRRALALLELVDIADPPAVARRYPHQLSGGMQQRIVIAMALAGDPSLLVMDEPTTGLDVTTQARIIELVRALKRKVRAAILYITHDLGVVAQVSDRVGILYAGELMETAPVSRAVRPPRAPVHGRAARRAPRRRPAAPVPPDRGAAPRPDAAAGGVRVRPALRVGGAGLPGAAPGPGRRSGTATRRVAAGGRRSSRRRLSRARPRRAGRRPWGRHAPS